ncbi:MAG TPA: cysteine desulfurase family protein [Terriglobales bacterium]|nr:cysteine desulfurase family protein [Terriglobales bacterium]
MARVYLDNNATTPLLPEVLEAMLPYLRGGFGNASSIHSHGQATRAAVERARESVARLIGARASEIVFTSGGTEADNLAVFGVISGQLSAVSRQQNHIITSTIEHHAVLNACRHLEALGYEVTYLAVDASGIVDPADVRRALRDSTRLISVMMANNETGVVQAVAEIGAIAREADVLFHTDAVQAAGKIRINVDEIGCDLLTLSAHKLHGPQGVGALYVRKGTSLEAQMYGGRHERSRRAGTENVAGIVGMGAASEAALAGFARGDDLRIGELRDRLERGLLEIEACSVNGRDAHLSQSARRMGHPLFANGADKNPHTTQSTRCMGHPRDSYPLRVPNTSNICFEGIDGEALVIALDLKGLAVSTGAACSSGAIEASHVLLAMGLSPERARGSVRFSLGKMNSAEDVEFALRVVPETVARLRELSPVWKEGQRFEVRG